MNWQYAVTMISYMHIRYQKLTDFYLLRAIFYEGHVWTIELLIKHIFSFLLLLRFYCLNTA